MHSVRLEPTTLTLLGTIEVQSFFFLVFLNDGGLLSPNSYENRSFFVVRETSSSTFSPTKKAIRVFVAERERGSLL